MPRTPLGTIPTGAPLQPVSRLWLTCRDAMRAQLAVLKRAGFLPGNLYYLKAPPGRQGQGVFGSAYRFQQLPGGLGQLAFVIQGNGPFQDVFRFILLAQLVQGITQVIDNLLVVGAQLGRLLEDL